MENLHLLLNSLSRAQLRLLRKFLTCFSSRGEGDAKTLHLLELLLETSTSPVLESCSRQLYNAEPDTRILKLKSRLKSKVLDALLLDINLEHRGLFDKKELATIKIRKKLAQYSYLSYKFGDKPIVKQLIDEVIQLSKKFEHYSGVIEGLKFKKYYKGFRIGEKEFHAINKELEFYEACSKAVGKAADYYYLKMMKGNFKGNVDQRESQNFLRECIADLKKEYEYTRSATVGFYLKYLEQFYHENNSNFEAAREACLQQLSIVNKHPAVYRKQRVGIIYDNIAQFDILLSDYKRAVNNALAAQKHFLKKSVNYFISKEIEFEALFYAEEFQKAKTVSATLVNAVASQSGDFRSAKYRFFRANVLFMLGEYREALKLLSERLELSKDKSGWEIAIRVLMIMNHLELERYDYVSQLVEGLRRHMDRHGKQTEMRERDRTIIKVMQKMVIRGFDPGQISEKELNLLRQLASKDGKQKWEPLTPELIPFHEWAARKYRLNLAAKPTARAKKKEVAV